MKVVSILLCEDALIDIDSNRVSVINILDNIASSQFPFVVPSLTTFLLFSREDGEAAEQSADVKISVNGAELISTTVFVNFLQHSLNRTRVKIVGVVIPAAGELVAEVSTADGIQKWITPVRQAPTVAEVTPPSS